MKNNKRRKFWNIGKRGSVSFSGKDIFYYKSTLYIFKTYSSIKQFCVQSASGKMNSWCSGSSTKNKSMSRITKEYEE